ncbi:unnamed protein product [Bursaphelenchus okinawaensis]|uniref:DUF148 domain-containing protein n=1 Tax=Bursaphelenchus okinawaensis TaxID=465554 RepID=A0A811LGD1_9BILA|nr:unnamed protein product [Bursaphelenchus okinawaensis]CAG9121935.1 unnamed protein product [Bursaphelenchus okinawaensis]
MQTLSVLLLVSSLVLVSAQFGGGPFGGGFGGMGMGGGQFGGGNGPFAQAKMAEFRQKMDSFRMRPEYGRLSPNARNAYEQVRMIINSPSQSMPETIGRVRSVVQSNPAAVQEFRNAGFSLPGGGPQF